MTRKCQVLWSVSQCVQRVQGFSLLAQFITRCWCPFKKVVMESSSSLRGHKCRFSTLFVMRPLVSFCQTRVANRSKFGCCCWLYRWQEHRALRPPKALIRLADGLDVVPMLVSHFDSCFTIRRLDLWQPISPKLSRLLLWRNFFKIPEPKNFHFLAI